LRHRQAHGELGLTGMVNKGELLINVVTLQLAKDDDTLKPKGMGKR
jgi:hypothetical protein